MNIESTDALKARYDADERDRTRRYQEMRPKNAGTHADQLKRAATRTNRRKAKQEGWED